MHRVSISSSWSFLRPGRLSKAEKIAVSKRAMTEKREDGKKKRMVWVDKMPIAAANGEDDGQSSHTTRGKISASRQVERDLCGD